MPLSDTWSLLDSIARACADATARGVTDRNEMQRLVGRAIASYNDAPQQAFGGLSPNAAARLLLTDWVSPEEPLTLNRALPLDEVDSADLLHNARTMLGMMVEEPLGETATGNINRRAVTRLVEGMRWEPEFLTDLHEHNKVLNETDVMPIYLLRHMLQRQKLITRRKGFRITKLGRQLLGDERAGELYARLFESHVLEPVYFAMRGVDPGAALDGLPIAVWRLAHEVNDWTPLLTLAGFLEPEPMPSPQIADDEELDLMEFYRLLNADNFVFRRFVELGLLDRRERGRKWSGLQNVDYRVTPLFGRAFIFLGGASGKLRASS